MWRQLYTIFTTYEGMYLFYLLPVVYFLTIIFRTIYPKIKCHEQIGVRDVLAATAIMLLFWDFMYYLYLFLTNTGKLLPLTILSIKYAIGCFFWIWVLWYSYEEYFARHVAGDLFTKRRAALVLLGAGSLVLTCIGITIS